MCLDIVAQIAFNIYRNRHIEVTIICDDNLISRRMLHASIYQTMKALKLSMSNTTISITLIVFYYIRKPFNLAYQFPVTT